jgi:hypothetical protein
MLSHVPNACRSIISIFGDVFSVLPVGVASTSSTLSRALLCLVIDKEHPQLQCLTPPSFDWPSPLLFAGLIWPPCASCFRWHSSFGFFSFFLWVGVEGMDSFPGLDVPSAVSSIFYYFALGLALYPEANV